MKRHVIHILLLSVFSSCEIVEPVGTEVQLPVDEGQIEVVISTQEVYDSDEPAVALLVNNSRYEVYISGECKGMLQHDDQGIWWPPEPVECLALACDWTAPCDPPPDRLIAPGTTYTDTLVSSPHPRLDYRFRYIYRLIDREGDLLPTEKTRTAPFVVRSTWGAGKG